MIWHHFESELSAFLISVIMSDNDINWNVCLQNELVRWITSEERGLYMREFVYSENTSNTCDSACWG